MDGDIIAAVRSARDIPWLSRHHKAVNTAPFGTGMLLTNLAPGDHNRLQRWKRGGDKRLSPYLANKVSVNDVDLIRKTSGFRVLPRGHRMRIAGLPTGKIVDYRGGETPFSSNNACCLGPLTAKVLMRSRIIANCCGGGAGVWRCSAFQHRSAVSIELLSPPHIINN